MTQANGGEEGVARVVEVPDQFDENKDPGYKVMIGEKSVSCFEFYAYAEYLCSALNRALAPLLSRVKAADEMGDKIGKVKALLLWRTDDVKAPLRALPDSEVLERIKNIVIASDSSIPGGRAG